MIRLLLHFLLLLLSVLTILVLIQAQDQSGLVIYLYIADFYHIFVTTCNYYCS